MHAKVCMYTHTRAIYTHVQVHTRMHTHTRSHLLNIIPSVNAIVVAMKVNVVIAEYRTWRRLANIMLLHLFRTQVYYVDSFISIKSGV